MVVGGGGARDYEFIPQRTDRGHSAEVSVTQQVYWLGLLRTAVGQSGQAWAFAARQQDARPLRESEGLTP